MRRNWVLAALTLVLAILGGGAAALVVGPQYQAESTLVLVPPRAAVERAASAEANAPRNPLLYLVNLVQARDVVIASLSSQDFADKMDTLAPGTKVSVTSDPIYQGPIIVVNAQSKYPDMAIAGLQVVNDAAPQSLAKIQSDLGIVEAERITLNQLTVDSRPTASRKQQIQVGALLALGVGGLGLVLIAARERRLAAAPRAQP